MLEGPQHHPEPALPHHVAVVGHHQGSLAANATAARASIIVGFGTCKWSKSTPRRRSRRSTAGRPRQTSNRASEARRPTRVTRTGPSHSSTVVRAGELFPGHVVAAPVAVVDAKDADLGPEFRLRRARVRTCDSMPPDAGG